MEVKVIVPYILNLKIWRSLNVRRHFYHHYSHFEHKYVFRFGKWCNWSRTGFYHQRWWLGPFIIHRNHCYHDCKGPHFKHGQEGMNGYPLEVEEICVKLAWMLIVWKSKDSCSTHNVIRLKRYCTWNIVCCTFESTDCGVSVDWLVCATSRGNAVDKR